MKFFEKRKLKKQVGKLSKYERHLLRLKTRYTTKISTKKQEIFKLYLNQGKMPPRRLALSYRSAQRLERVVDEKYARIREGKAILKERLRDVKSGFDPSLKTPDDIQVILSGIDDFQLDDFDNLFEAIEQEQYDMSPLIEQERMLGIKEQQLDTLMEQESVDVVREWEGPFLEKIAGEFPDEFANVPESIRKRANNSWDDNEED